MLILFGSINKCVQVSITWLEDRPYSYRALYKLWEVLNSSPSQIGSESAEALLKAIHMDLMDTYV
jgi:hypothetical protein